MAGLNPVTQRRVSVTDVSTATELGLPLDNLWAGPIDGRPGISPLPLAQEPSFPVRIAGQVSDEALAAEPVRLGVKDPDRSTQLALVTAGAALEHAGPLTDGETHLNLDTAVASGHGPVVWATPAAQTFAEHGYSKVRPVTVLRAIFNRRASMVAIRYGLPGNDGAGWHRRRAHHLDGRRRRMAPPPRLSLESRRRRAAPPQCSSSARQRRWMAPPPPHSSSA